MAISYRFKRSIIERTANSNDAAGAWRNQHSTEVDDQSASVSFRCFLYHRSSRCEISIVV